MTELEQTIIALAKNELAAVLCYYRDKEGISEGEFEDEYREYLVHSNAMHILIALAHQAGSGLSEDAIQSLLELEDQHSEAYRASMKRKTPNPESQMLEKAVVGGAGVS